MPKFYCEYCGIYLTHSSPSGRKQHVHGRKHINNKIEYYSQFLMDQSQTMNLRNAYAGNEKESPNIGLPKGVEAYLQGNPTINLPGIMPSNIKTL